MPTALVSWSTEVFFIPSVTAQCLVSFSSALRSCSVSKSVKAKVAPPEIWPFWFFRSYYIILLSVLQEVSEKNSFFCGRKDKVPMNSTSRRWNEKPYRRTTERRKGPAGHTGRQQSALQRITAPAIQQRNRTAWKPIWGTERKTRKILRHHAWNEPVSEREAFASGFRIALRLARAALADKTNE